MSKIENVSLETEANVYFDGKCISYAFYTSDGERKTVGVIFPASLTFGTGAPEVMEMVKGECRIRLAGSDEWKTYKAGEQFSVPGDSSFDIEVIETMNYLCHYG